MGRILTNPRSVASVTSESPEVPVYRSVGGLIREGNASSSAGPARTRPVAREPAAPSLPPEPVCPFCGLLKEKRSGRCSRCTMEDTPQTRQATQAKLGGWFLYQVHNPSTPGMNFATLLALIRRGRVTHKSILRGPTTGQFWRYAARTKGVSRELGLCWNCGDEIQRSTRICPRCKHFQEPPINPDVLLEGEPLQSPAPPPLQAGQETEVGTPATMLNMMELADMDPAIEPAMQASPAAVPSNQSAASVPPPVAAPAPQAAEPRATAFSRPAMDLVESTLVSGCELAAFNLPPDYAVGARPQRVLRGVLLALVVAGLTFATFLYCNPEWQRQYAAWGRNTARRAWQLIAGRTDTAPPNTIVAAANNAAPGNAISLNTPGKASSPALPAEATPVESTWQSLVGAPASQPTVSAPARTEISLGPGTATVAPPVQPAPAPPTSTKHTETPSILVTPPDPDPALAGQRAMDLWEKAIAAQEKGNYAHAIELFRQIKALPEFVWPMGLDVRLRLAQDQLRQSGIPDDPSKSPR